MHADSSCPTQCGGNWSAAPLGGGGDFTAIQRLSLPAGKYIANASAHLVSNDANLHVLSCIFTIDGRSVSKDVRGKIGGTVNNFITLPLTAGFTINTSKELALACRGDFPGIVVSQPSPITAIRVDRLIVTEGFEALRKERWDKRCSCD